MKKGILLLCLAAVLLFIFAGCAGTKPAAPAESAAARRKTAERKARKGFMRKTEADAADGNGSPIFAEIPRPRKEKLSTVENAAAFPPAACDPTAADILFFATTLW